MDINVKSARGVMSSSITAVVDSEGTLIPNNTPTEDPVLSLSGIGAASSVVFIFDNGELLTPASVTINGTWTFTKTVVLGRHAFTVRDTLGGVDSTPWVITVVEAELDLQPPTVTQAPGDILNPIDAINGATVVVTYAMQTTDTIGLSWNGLDNLVPTQQGSTLGSVTFTIPPSAVAAVIGKTIPVLYAVVRNGVPKPSEQLDLTVQTLSDSVLEAPRILQANDGVNLDVGALTGDADLRVKPWPFIAAGQLISLRFEGTKEAGSAYNWAHPTWQDLPISSAGEPSTTVALDKLKGLKNGSSLTLVFEVSFDDGLTRVLFPLSILNVSTVEMTSGFENFESEVPRDLVLGVPVLLASGLTLLLVTPDNLTGQRTCFFRSAPEWPALGEIALFLGNNSLTRFQLSGGVRQIEFEVRAVHTECWAVNYFDMDGMIIGRLSIPVTGSYLIRSVLFSPVGKLIRSFEVTGHDNSDSGIRIDNIRWGT